MKILICLFAALVFSTVADARIGESPSQCRQRYGRAEFEDGTTSVFRTPGYEIRAQFAADACEVLKFSKTRGEGWETISAAELAAILAANGNGKKWVTVREGAEWTTEDKTRGAVMDGKALVVFTAAWLKRDRAQAAARDRGAVKGF